MSYSTSQRPPNFRDLTDQPFNELIAREYVGNSHWRCDCSCGRTTIVASSKLRSGYTRSCGHLRSTVTRQTKRTHGHALKGQQSPEYRVWCNIKDRCLNPNVRNYHRYGGRGVMICDRWCDSFVLFLRDMGPRPSPQYSIERRKNDLGYTPENCYWATARAQARNRRSNRYLTHNNETLLLIDWAVRTGISLKRLSARHRAGWSDEAVLTTPICSQKIRHS